VKGGQTMEGEDAVDESVPKIESMSCARNVSVRVTFGILCTATHLTVDRTGSTFLNLGDPRLRNAVDPSQEFRSCCEARRQREKMTDTKRMIRDDEQLIRSDSCGTHILPS
jgi:hypothetical protein